jgi:ribosome maturation factor RimP
MITKDNIREMLDERFQGSNLFLAGIDGDQAVTVDDCRELSRYIESQLGRDSEDYELTVSSPGTDRPLFIARQYPKHVGKTLNVITHNGEQVKGKLADADHERIFLEQDVRISKKETEKRIVVLGFHEIKSAKVELEFRK